MGKLIRIKSTDRELLKGAQQIEHENFKGQKAEPGESGEPPENLKTFLENGGELLALPNNGQIVAVVEHMQFNLLEELQGGKAEVLFALDSPLRALVSRSKILKNVWNEYKEFGKRNLVLIHGILRTAQENGSGAGEKLVQEFVATADKLGTVLFGFVEPKNLRMLELCFRHNAVVDAIENAVHHPDVGKGEDLHFRVVRLPKGKRMELAGKPEFLEIAQGGEFYRKALELMRNKGYVGVGIKVDKAENKAAMEFRKKSQTIVRSCH